MMGEESQYSLMVGMMYVFNSMFGIGILALPKAFADAGWLASSVILVLAMVMSYITVTFLIEVMSSANARVVWNRNNDIHKENEMILKENVPLSGKREEESTHTKALHSESFSKYICCYYCLPDDRKPSVFDINEFLSLTDLTKMYFSTVFWIMFVMAFYLLAIGRGKGNPTLANFGALPNIFGACSLAAVSHATLPHIIPPIQNKTNLGLGIAIVFIVVSAFYALLSLLIMFTFENDKIQEIVLLNFLDCSIVPGMFFIYFLGLYTTFKVSAVFPLNAVALRDNIRAIFSSFQSSHIWVVESLLFPLLTIIPPIVIAVITENIEVIVGITGSYAATIIQFIIPPLLVHYSRRDTQEKFGLCIPMKHASPFQHNFWIILAITFAVFTITSVTILYVTR
nr:transmembrane protein 104-like isoform X4 [Pelodiscus sinensis]|eukprot:XP_025041205.1 transmembrane protein 104-like isoform X4 [Pelodiscus sinensis]